MKPNQLKMERALRGWSQARVAEAVGTNVRTVIRWEQGQTLPHPYYQEQLCALFGKNARELGLLVENDPPVEPAIDEPVVQRQDPHSTPLAIETPLFDPAIPAALVNAGGLIGRERLLTDLKQQLWEGGNRTLIALQGLPGMGKTALAVALTHDHLLRERFRDGILWAGLGQEADVLSQLARWGKLLGIAPGDVGNAESRDAWGKALRAVIGSRRMLLIIDDAWSVEDALALQVGGAHCAHVLTTRLPTVAFAFAKEGTQIVPELKTDDGLALLTQFVPHLVQQDEANARTLVQAVGGSPLALTLMGNYLATQAFTGRTRRMRQALTQLHDAEQRMRLSAPVALEERSPSLPADTPLSLYAAIAVSVQRLSQEDQLALYALATFPPKPNSFSEEAALAVSTASVETLDTLWDAGLLESSELERYTLHQTIVDYANTQLSQALALQARQRLVTYMSRYVQQHQQDYNALEREQNNILAALDSAATLDMPHALLEGVLALTSFLRVRGYYAQADRLLTQALHNTTTSDDTMGRMKLLRHLAAFAEVRGDYSMAEQYSQAGLALARQIGRQHEIESALLTTLGLVAYHHGNYAQAKDMFTNGLHLARTLGNQEQICLLLTHLGRVLHYQGDYLQAETLYQEGLTLARAIEQHELLNRLLIYLGATCLSQGDHLRAQRYQQEGLSLARALGHREYLEALLNDMGIMAYNQGELSTAMSYFQEGLALAQQIGHSADCCLLLSNLGAIAIEQGDYTRAEHYLHEGIELARSLENRNRLTLLLANLGSARGHQGDYQQANRYFQESLALAHTIGAPRYIYTVLLDWGEIHLKYKQLDAARAAFQEVIAQEKSPGKESELAANALYGLARIAHARGQIADAIRLAQESEAAFTAIENHKATKVREWRQSLYLSIPHS